MQDFGSIFGENGLYGKLPSDTCAVKHMSCLCGRNQMDKEIIMASGSIRDASE